MGLRLIVAIAGILIASDMQVTAGEVTRSPIRWFPPPSFSRDKPGLGLPQLKGITHYTIFDPIPSKANISDGGNGQYESLRHGTYNHHARIILFKDKLIVYWTNHTGDENGPGQRVIGKVGTFRNDRKDIAWGGNETLVELAPAVTPASRRLPRLDADVMQGGFVNVSLDIINGKLYVRGLAWACHGWANDVKYHGRRTEPIPPENWSPVHSRIPGYWWDTYWSLGMRFLQRWKVEDRKLIPDSPLYKKSDLLTRVEISPGKFAKVPPPTAPYARALPLSKAPRELQEDVVHGTPEQVRRYPQYAKGTFRLAADGKNGLGHYAEFRRPDGKWVVIRDNLINPGYYYTALKEKQGDDYLPAAPTNLYGGVMPEAGELPDGRPWIICNSQSRTDMYLTLSEDGITFDRTWLLLHVDRQGPPGFSKASRGGPQYFHAVTVGPNIWVAYSIAQTQIGVSKIPIDLLRRRPKTNSSDTSSHGTLEAVSRADDSDVRFVAPVPKGNAQTMWDTRELYRVPAMAPATDIQIEAEKGISPLFFEGVPFRGNPTRIFAWYGVPDHATGKVPGMVLVHGGGGTAFQYWVKLWTARGYAAIAMDTCGAIPIRPKGRKKGWLKHSDGGPSLRTVFNTVDDPIQDQWTYQAVAAVVRAHSLLRSFPEVDASRIGLTGISWGGYLTCIVAGVDSRFRFAAPVYGCGFLGENSSWVPRFRAMGHPKAMKWIRLWDPSQYICYARMPMLFCNGTNDHHYPLDSWQKTYRTARGTRTLCCRVRMRHAHPPAGDPPEITAFADSVLKRGKPLPKITGQGRDSRIAWARFTCIVPVGKAELNYTRDTGNWEKKKWKTVPAALDGQHGRVSAPLPEGTRAFYFNLQDRRGFIVSTSHEELEQPIAVRAR